MKDFDKFLYFSRSQLETGCYDAHIPFLKGLKDHLGLCKERSLWMGILYMAYYTEGSMWCAFSKRKVQRREQSPPTDLPITTQRRNLYGGRIGKHLNAWMSLESLCEWFDSVDSWSSLLELLSTIYGNGRWASYTTAELLTHLGEMNIEPTSYEIVQSSGPRKGLIALELPPEDSSADLVLKEFNREGIEIPPSVLESLLCDWAGMCKGSFYAGRNIDRQQGRILDVEKLTGRTFSTLWQIRKRTFPEYTLGESRGWQGIDKLRLKHYRDTGRVILPQEQRR